MQSAKFAPPASKPAAHTRAQVQLPERLRKLRRQTQATGLVEPAGRGDGVRRAGGAAVAAERGLVRVVGAGRGDLRGEEVVARHAEAGRGTRRGGRRCDVTKSVILGGWYLGLFGPKP